MKDDEGGLSLAKGDEYTESSDHEDAGMESNDPGYEEKIEKMEDEPERDGIEDDEEGVDAVESSDSIDDEEEACLGNACLAITGIEAYLKTDEFSVVGIEGNCFGVIVTG